MISGSPTVSVLMPVYNGEAHLLQALESIGRQTFKDIEIVIVDDGSTDASGEIVDAYRQLDSRVNYYYQPNSGIVNALNNGLERCRGKFIARMDADDISFPNRIKTQVDFLRSNPSVFLCGMQSRYIDDMGNLLSKDKRWPETHDEILTYAIFFSPLVHPSVMFRRMNSLRYSREYEYAEDYELWTRLLTEGKILVNLPQFGIFYRVHDQSITGGDSSRSKAAALRVRSRYLRSNFPCSQVPSVSFFCAYYSNYFSLSKDMEVCKELAKSFTESIKIFSLVNQSEKFKNLVFVRSAIIGGLRLSKSFLVARKIVVSLVHNLLFMLAVLIMTIIAVLPQFRRSSE